MQALNYLYNKVCNFVLLLQSRIVVLKWNMISSIILQVGGPTDYHYFKSHNAYNANIVPNLVCPYPHVTTINSQPSVALDD